MAKLGAFLLYTLVLLAVVLPLRECLVQSSIIRTVGYQGAILKAGLGNATQSGGSKLVSVTQHSADGTTHSTTSLQNSMAKTGIVFSEVLTPIWVWSDYPSGQQHPAFLDICQKSWKLFAPSDQFDLRFVNSSNIHKWLPDWPEEDIRTLYPAATSDVVRAGLLAQHGGVYLDHDFLLTARLSEITDKLKDYDMVTYTSDNQNCNHGQFSGNFMAARPGNPLHVAWYEEAKKQLKQSCNETEMKTDNKACCYESSGQPRVQCHSPWGMLGERTYTPLLKKMIAAGSRFKTFCFNERDQEGLAPCPECLWASIPSGKSLCQINCTLEGLHQADLKCRFEGTDHVHGQIFSRRAYHLSNFVLPETVHDLSWQELVQGPWVFSELLRRKGIV